MKQSQVSSHAGEVRYDSLWHGNIYRRPMFNPSAPSLTEDQYRSFIENLPVLFYAVDPTPPFSPIYVSPAFDRFGYPTEDWYADPEMWIRVIHPDDREWVFEHTSASTATGEAVDYEYRILDSNGMVHWVRDRGCLIRNETGNVVCREGVILDITDRKRAEDELKLGEQRYRNIFENASDIIYVHDLDGNYLSINDAGQRIFGYTREESLGMNMRQIVASEHFELAKEQLASKLRGGPRQTAYELDCIRKDGRLITLEVNSSAIYKDGLPVAIQGIARDVTERKASEAALMESEANLAAAQRITHLGSWELEIFDVNDSNENTVRWSDEVFRIFGFEPKEFEVTSSLVYQSIHPDDRAYVSESFTEAVLENKFLDLETRIILPDGTIRLLHGQAETVFDQDSNPVKMVGTVQDITERRKTEQAVSESEARFRDLFENANDLIYTHDLNGNFTSINRTGEKITGYTREEATEMNVDQVVAPEYLEQARRMIATKVVGEGPTAYELEIISKGGSRVSLELSTRLIFLDDKPVGVQGIGRDITERKRTEEALKASEQRYRQLGEGILHQIWTARPDGMLDYVNKRTLEYFERSNDEMIGDGWKNVVHQDDVNICLERWNNSLNTGEPYETEFRLRRHDGEYRWHVAKATAGRDSFGNINKWFGTNTDIHEQKESEEKLNYYARHDTLTDLPNRTEFMNQLRLSIARSNERADARFAVLFLDLDRFKVINDSLGHVIGDKLLIAISSRLKAAVRPGDVVARLGGDEFTVLLNRTGSEADVTHVVERIQAKIADPFTIDNYEVFTTTSVGVVLSDDVKREAEDYLRDADAAMYRAKERGKARYEIFDREMHVHNLNLLQVETDLRHAVERHEFEVLYQPIVELDTGRVAEFEALIRWRHPVQGLISPKDFVGVAEETGLIIPIGKWIIEESCRQIAHWQENFDHRLSVSVNLSAKQLMHPTLTSQVEDILAETGLDPRQLKLEVTESTVMENSERALAVLNELDILGVHLSTDDFGTGYSSLSYLQRFPFDRLKIDRSFIDKLGDNKKSDAIVKTILMLGTNLGIQVVAEGIETESQLELLQSLGCSLGQGYLFSRPVDADTAEKLLRHEGTTTAYDPTVRMAADEQLFELTVLQ